jgi:hypothetical protein
MDSIARLMRTPYDRLTGNTRLTMENDEAVRRSLAKHFDQLSGQGDGGGEDPDDSKDGATGDGLSSIWDQVFSSELKEVGDFSKISKMRIDNKLKLNDPNHYVVEFQEYYNEVELSLENYAKVQNPTLLLALARNAASKVPDKYKFNDHTMAIILRTTTSKSIESNAVEQIKPFKQQGFNSLRALLKFSDPNSWSSKMVEVNKLTSMEFKEEDCLDSFLLKGSKQMQECATKNITLQELYLGQLIKSFDKLKDYQSALTSMQNGVDEISEASIRKTVSTVRDNRKREIRPVSETRALLQTQDVTLANALVENQQLRALLNSAATPPPVAPIPRCKGCNGNHSRSTCPHKNNVCACGIRGHITAACMNGGVPRTPSNPPSAPATSQE